MTFDDIFRRQVVSQQQVRQQALVGRIANTSSGHNPTKHNHSPAPVLVEQVQLVTDANHARETDTGDDGTWPTG